MLISAEEQINSVIQIHAFFFQIFFSIMVYHRRWNSALCCTVGLLFIHSVDNHLLLLAPALHSISLPTPPPWQPHIPSLCLWVVLFCRQVHPCCILDSAYEGHHVTCLSLSHLLHLVWSSLVASMWLQVALCRSSYGWVVFRCICIPSLLCPVICLGTFRLSPCLDYCE